ncbi:hypothetical protein [Cyanothece sp. BG0011]|uniref:hypothetical protein n=1 Tax=Cyanothece sp. BG0011 TaxID=2082950 RepID=UPI0018E5A1DC|nr:hypothetical protein [Cyanothece sp. BG0011]
MVTVEPIPIAFRCDRHVRLLDTRNTSLACLWVSWSFTMIGKDKPQKKTMV